MVQFDMTVEELADQLSWLVERTWYGNGKYGLPQDTPRRQGGKKAVEEFLKELENK